MNTLVYTALPLGLRKRMALWMKRQAWIPDRGWRAALQRCRAKGGPRLLYLSYADAGGTAERLDLCAHPLMRISSAPTLELLGRCHL